MQHELHLPRLAWTLAGMMAGIASVRLGSPWLLTAWLGPDLGILAGGLTIANERGDLNRRATAGYNATHSLLGPALLVAAGGLLGSRWIIAVGLLWLCHIAIDRAFGYGLKSIHA